MPDNRFLTRARPPHCPAFTLTLILLFCDQQVYILAAAVLDEGRLHVRHPVHLELLTSRSISLPALHLNPTLLHSAQYLQTQNWGCGKMAEYLGLRHGQRLCFELIIGVAQ